jgi:hypothetical protein
MQLLTFLHNTHDDVHNNKDDIDCNTSQIDDNDAADDDKDDEENVQSVISSIGQTRPTVMSSLCE